MRFRKFVSLSFVLLACSCSSYEARNDFYIGETGTHGWMTVTFEDYHIVPFDEDTFYLDYTLHLNMTNEFPYQLKKSETGVDGWWTNTYDDEKVNVYNCDVIKNVEANGYDIFEKEDIAGDYSYTFFVKLPNTIYHEQGKEDEKHHYIDIGFIDFCFRTCTREYIESLE